MKEYRYYHRYNLLFPLNIYVKKWVNDLRKLLHFFIYSIGLDLILKEIKKISID